MTDLITRLSKLDAPDRVPPVTYALDWKPETWAAHARRGAFGFVPHGINTYTKYRVSLIDVDQICIAILRAKEAST